jgi:mediator of RNA polymerase II transcription subunit 12, fungi type
VSTDVLLAVVDNLRRNLDLWVCMDVVDTIVHTLLSVHISWKSKGVHIRNLVQLLLDIDGCRILDAESRQLVIEGAAHFAQVGFVLVPHLQPSLTSTSHVIQALRPRHDAPDVIPPALPEVLALLHTTDDTAAEIANGLWYKYRSSIDWVYVVWDNVISSIQQGFVMNSDRVESVAIAFRFAQFLLHIDLHSPDGIDGHAMRWFAGPGVTAMPALNSESWFIANTMFVYLAVHGALNITTLLQGVVFPAWAVNAAVTSPEAFQENVVFLRSAYILCQLLLVNHKPLLEYGYPALDLMEIQRLNTRRKEVYRDETFRLLVERIPMLFYIENSEHLDESFRSSVEALRRSLCQDKDFRLGAARNIGEVVQAFAKSLDPCTFQETLHVPLVKALRLVFNDEDEDYSRGSALLSPWKLSVTAAVTSFVLQQIGQLLGTVPGNAKASIELNDLADKLVHESVSAEEADFVSEMVKDVNPDVAGVVRIHVLLSFCQPFLIRHISVCEQGSTAHF